MSNASADTWLMTQRHFRNLIRQPVWTFISLVQPVVWLLLSRSDAEAGGGRRLRRPPPRRPARETRGAGLTALPWCVRPAGGRRSR